MNAADDHRPDPRDPFAIARAAKLAAQSYAAVLPPEDPAVQAMRRYAMEQGMAEDARRIKERQDRRASRKAHDVGTVSVPAAAAMLDVTSEEIYAAIDRGELPATRTPAVHFPGTTTQVSIGALSNWFDSWPDAREGNA